MKGVSEIKVAASLNASVISMENEEEEELQFELDAPLDSHVTCGGFLPHIQLKIQDTEGQDMEDFTDYVNVEFAADGFAIACDNGPETLECGKIGLFFKMNDEDQGILEFQGDRLLLLPANGRTDGSSLGANKVNKGRATTIEVKFFRAKCVVDLGGNVHSFFHSLSR